MGRAELESSIHGKRHNFSKPNAIPPNIRIKHPKKIPITMPCYDPDTHDRPIRLAAKIHKLTEMLCYLCTIVDTIDRKIIPFNPTLNDWWIKHQEFDRKGQEIEDKVKAYGANVRLGIESLTPEERSHYFARQTNSAENP